MTNKNSKPAGSVTNSCGKQLMYTKPQRCELNVARSQEGLVKVRSLVTYDMGGQNGTLVNPQIATDVYPPNMVSSVLIHPILWILSSFFCRISVGKMRVCHLSEFTEKNDGLFSCTEMNFLCSPVHLCGWKWAAEVFFATADGISHLYRLTADSEHLQIDFEVLSGSICSHGGPVWWSCEWKTAELLVKLSGWGANNFWFIMSTLQYKIYIYKHIMWSTQLYDKPCRKTWDGLWFWLTTFFFFL
jgi:hypothetical protein